MLTSLSIKNFAIVSELELDFSTGMTAYTGETGAGKSIMIDALALALGGRADGHVVRPGSDKCEIHACFDFDNQSRPHIWLKDHDIDDSEGFIYLRRVIYAEGRSKSYINGQPFPLQKLKELSEGLVDIHGQHQHQTLLNHTTHRIQLDQFAKHSSLVKQVEQAFKTYKSLEKSISQLEPQVGSEERQALLKFQIEELMELNLQAGELTSLHDEHQMLHHAKTYLVQTQNITQVLGADEAMNVTSSLNHILQSLSELPEQQPQIKNTLELINSALIQCEEAQSELEDFAEQVQLDPERLQEVEERMSQLHQAARKYHVEPNQLPEHLEQLKKDLSNLDHVDAELQDMRQALQQEYDNYQSLALQLRDSRAKHAKKLEKDISSAIRQLGMPHGYIQLMMTPLDKMQSHGLDKVEYQVCTNPGMQPDTLSKVASGGELSRISLAIQMITAQRGSTPTLLFDEVDVGIGGATAALVGQMLRKLGERLQIFCVTHQPQVAASAHHHFLVEKQTKDKQTFSKVTALNDEAKIEEIARMLGGIQVTEQTRSHAKELMITS